MNAPEYSIALLPKIYNKIKTLHRPELPHISFLLQNVNQIVLERWKGLITGGTKLVKGPFGQ